MRALVIWVGAALLAAGSVPPAEAHPHVWVTTKAEVIYAADGKVAALRHAWTFDEGYSAYVSEGMVENGRLSPDKAAALAKTNTDSLAEYGYFTSLRAGGAKLAFEPPRDAAITLDQGRLTLNFTLPLRAPSVAHRLLLDVSDPTFFVDFSIAEGEDAVKLSGAPPQCTATIQRPKPLDPAEQQKLSEAFFQALTAASNVGAQFANRTLVSCP